MGKSLAFLKEPESKDGQVLSVSEHLALGWIDIGADERLARGTRFRVVSGKIGAQKLKGWAEVTEVKPTMAEVSFSEIVDRFDPIVEGDVIFNPIYDPKGERTAVLCGANSPASSTRPSSRRCSRTWRSPCRPACPTTPTT